MTISMTTYAARLPAISSLLLSLAMSFSMQAHAALDLGQAAPKFSAPAALAGKPFVFSLAAALAKGPVVLYFFPAAFSQGCSIEAHEFAEAIEKFQALGASVVGVSTDDIDTLSKFSSQVCQGKFPVASDESRAITQSFDAVMQTRPDFANRISYVIAQDGSVAFYYLNLNPTRHVEKTLDALRALQRSKPAKPTSN